MARQLLADWDNVEEAMRQSFTLQRGKISIAAMPSFAANVLPEVLKAFRDRYAGINVTVHDVINEQVIEMVREGRVEMGIAFEPAPTNNLLFTPLGVDRFIAIVPKSSPLAGKRVLLARAADAGFYYAAAAFSGPPDAGRGAGAQRPSAGCRAGESPAGDGGQNGGQRPRRQRRPGALSVADAGAGRRMLPLDNPPIEKCIGVIHAGHLQLSKAAQALLGTLKGALAA
jgi:LysR family carnitine catabolism transcriptional activator